MRIRIELQNDTFKKHTSMNAFTSEILSPYVANEIYKVIVEATSDLILKQKIKEEGQYILEFQSDQ